METSLFKKNLPQKEAENFGCNEFRTLFALANRDTERVKYETRYTQILHYSKTRHEFCSIQSASNTNREK